MSTPATVIKLPAVLQERIQKQIDSGAFADEMDVLHQALDTLERRQRDVQKLRDMITEADNDIANGRVGPFDTEKMIREVEDELEAHGVME